MTHPTAAAAAPSAPPDPQYLLGAATELVQQELAEVNRVTRERLASDIPLIGTLADHILGAGGKRLRPLILLLSARAGGYRGEQHIVLAAVIEFIHTATLLHDDVVDVSTMRRGRATANHVWGNPASVLVGDFLYSRAFEMMVEGGDMTVMAILATTTNAIAEGEVMQLLNAYAPDTDEEACMQTIHRKTARLFEAAAQLGGVVSARDAAACKALAAYGFQLGIAFQLIDDVLDYRADSARMGKEAGDDLAEGKPTLPFIYAFKRGDEQQRRVLRQALMDGARERIGEVVDIVEATGALAHTTAQAHRAAAAAGAALSVIGDSPYKAALIQLAEFAVRRGH